ncbi:MAG: permease [Deltaproteobacteria bacterium]|nr:MAG: permease [Deltaproteobacteria bacterium]
MLPLTVCLAFIFSFIFALGGVGSALALVPILHWLGVPLDAARPTGLMINVLSMGGASYANIKNKRLDFRLALPIIIASTLLAPAGAWCSTLISRQMVLWGFFLFMLFSSFMLLFYHKKQGHSDKKKSSFAAPALVGAGAGFLSGLLGVGGGMLISPLLIMMGFNPKKVAAITAFVVPFSSFTAFTAYALLGTVQWQVLIFAAMAAYFGGVLGTTVMQRHLKAVAIKRFLGILLIIMAGKLLYSLL